ncbi:MAG TPA: 5'-nucleotidase [Roseiflexaceae bacterium]|nr:5'-nucleotidase [Roseiflexaceae bacterium]
MVKDFSRSLVIGISSRALFDLRVENQIYEREGLEAYSAHQLAHEDQVLPPGAGFPLVRALLRLNELMPGERRVEVIIMSRNSPDIGLRLFRSIAHYGLDITRAAFVGGANLTPYLEAFGVGLFLSASEEHVQAAIDAGVPAGLIYDPPADLCLTPEQIRIAFDGDAVLFSEESERVYQTEGLDGFHAHEQALAREPLPEGPFARLLKTLAYLQCETAAGPPPIRTALVTARGSPAHERVIRTLRAWGVRVDEAFFLGGMAKHRVLQAFGAHIFFDDQDIHCHPASRVVPTARVPYPRRSEQ